MNTGTLRKILLFAFFSVLCLLILVPFYAVTIASFKPGEDLIRYGLNLRFDLSAMSLDNFVFCSPVSMPISPGFSIRCC